MNTETKLSSILFLPQPEDALQRFLEQKNKVIFSSYVHLEKDFVNEFSYQNSGDVKEEVLAVLYHADGRRVAEVQPVATVLKPLQAFSMDVAPTLAAAGYTSFRGSILFVAHPLEDTQDLAQRDFASYWASTRNAWRNACHIGVGASKEMNVTGKKEKRTYNMFCPAVVSNEKFKTLITIFNHSSEFGYSDTVSLTPVLHNLKGEKLEGAAMTVGPNATFLLDIDEVFKESGRALLKKTSGRGTTTILHRGHHFATLFFHIDRKTNEIINGSHTTPAASIPASYGVTRPLINAWSERTPLFYLLWKLKHIRSSWFIWIWQKFFYFAPRALYRILFPLHDRNPQMVKGNYNNRYQETLTAFRNKKPSFEEYLYGKASELDWVLVEDRVMWGEYALAHKSFLPQLDQYLAPYLVQPSATVIEFGCGTGRNLLYLKSQHPDVKFIGIELSDVGVALAREAAAAYGLDVQFIQADLTKPLNLGLTSTIAYSCFSLEQMPRKVLQATNNMAKTSGGKIILFEPVPELYSWDMRGLTSRFRAIVIDHVRNVLSTLRKGGYVIDDAKRMGMGNPLTEVCVVVAHQRDHV